MIEEKWTDLEKGNCPNHYRFNIESAYSCQSLSTIHFSQCTFDTNDEALVAVDNNGIAYYIDLSKVPGYKTLGSIGLCTVLTFNPLNRNQLFIGLSSTNIKILKINAINEFNSLTGHTAPPKNISFYKNYCLTSSSNEVIIWQLESFCKAHQLRLNIKNIIIKKAVFSNLGFVTVLYQSDLIQTWVFQQFNEDYKIDTQKYGLKNVKDFDFTKDGRAMIVCGLQNKILIFNTATWDLIKAIDLNENFNGGKQLLLVPQPIDGGANSIASILTSDCILKFLNLASSGLIETCCNLEKGIKTVIVSKKGRFLAYISKGGFIDILNLDKALYPKSICNVRKSKKPGVVEKKLHINKTEIHLKSIQKAMKEELKLERLLPILNEFGEYPEKHRKLIWITIMELPNNRKAYIDLSNKASPESIIELLKGDPLLNKCKNSIMGMTLSCLLYWCPILRNCMFLPKMILPLINIFQKDPILGFEASLFILLNHCQKWFEYHPMPPLNVLGIIENILMEADSHLFNYFCEHGITSTVYAWPLLQTLLSEVLEKNDWLILWDHVLSSQKPWMLLMCVVAYNISYRKTITTQLRTLDDFQQFYTTQGHVPIKTILKIALKLDCDTLYHIHPRRYLKNNISLIPKNEAYPPFLQFEFPKYLTDDLSRINLEILREKERDVHGLHLKAMELLEQKKLHVESEYFKKNIHERRLNETRRCYEKELHDNERSLNYRKKKIENFNSHKGDTCSNWTNQRLNSQSACSFEKKQRKNKGKNCKLLQEQVDKLESEVRNLLTALHNNSSRFEDNSLGTI